MTWQSFKRCMRSDSSRPLTPTVQDVKSEMTIKPPSSSIASIIRSFSLPEMRLHLTMCMLPLLPFRLVERVFYRSSSRQLVVSHKHMQAEHTMCRADRRVQSTEFKCEYLGCCSHLLDMIDTGSVAEATPGLLVS